MEAVGYGEFVTDEMQDFDDARNDIRQVTRAGKLGQNSRKPAFT